MKTQTIKLGNERIQVVSISSDNGKTEQNIIYVVIERSKKNGNVVFAFHRGANQDNIEAVYETEPEIDVVTGEFTGWWKCPTKTIPYLPEHIPYITGMNALECALIAFEYDNK